MVKKLEFEGSIEFASPEIVFKLLYKDDAFIKFYHKEVNGDNNASASNWSEEDGSRRREVIFKPRITNVPFLFRRLLGRLEMYAEIEARAIFKRWLNIARVFCEEKLGLEEEPSSEEEDLFYDAEDVAQEDVISTEEELMNIIPVTGLPTTPSLRHSEGGLQDWFVQEVWRSYCISVQNHAKLQKIEREIFLLNSSWTAFGLGIATGLGLAFLYNRQLNRQK